MIGNRQGTGRIVARIALPLAIGLAPFTPVGAAAGASESATAARQDDDVVRIVIVVDGMMKSRSGAT